jgi:FAD/FMN-containing dehydrogenase
MSLTDTLAGIVGAAHVVTDPDVLEGRSVDHTGRYRGHASMLVRPGSADEVSAVLHACRDAGAYVTVQGGRTSLVAGTVPEHDDVLELIDARASALTAEHVGVSAPVAGGWQLLIELAGDTDQTERLADALEDARVSGEPAVGVDIGAQQRLWQVRESVAEVLGVHGPPLKFDVSLPLWAIAGFAADSAELVTKHAPDATPVLFGHIGEGNLHLNVVRCGPDAERQLYSAMMLLIARRGGNVSSEHGIGTRKRDYVSMSRTEADIAAMRAVKAAFDPTGYLNPAVLFG